MSDSSGGWHPPSGTWPGPEARGWHHAPPEGGHAPPPGWGPPAAGGPGAGYVPPRKPGTVPLRPLGLGALLDGAFQTVRRNAGATLGLSVLVQVAVGVVMALASAPFMGVLFSPEAMAGAEPDLQEFGGSLLLFLAGVFGATLLSSAAVAFVQGAVTVPVLRAAVARPTRFGEGLALARPRLGALLGLGLLWIAATLVVLVLDAGVVVAAVATGEPVAGVTLGLAGTAAVGLAALFFLVRLSLAAHAIVAEGAGVFAGLARSWRLTGGSWWRVFGILLLTYVIVGFAVNVATTPLSFAMGLAGGLVDPADPEGLATLMVNLSMGLTAFAALVGGIAYAYFCCVSGLLYLDLRIRREGFDLVLLSEADFGTDTGIPGLPPAGHRPR